MPLMFSMVQRKKTLSRTFYAFIKIKPIIFIQSRGKVCALAYRYQVRVQERG